MMEEIRVTVTLVPNNSQAQEEICSKSTVWPWACACAIFFAQVLMANANVNDAVRSSDLQDSISYNPNTGSAIVSISGTITLASRDLPTENQIQDTLSTYLCQFGAADLTVWMRVAGWEIDDVFIDLDDCVIVDPESQSSTIVGEVCGRFSQSMTLEEVVSRELMEESIESLLGFRSFRYIANTERLTTDVAFNDLTQQQSESGKGTFTLMDYTICYEQPLSVAPLEKIQSYPRQLVLFLQLETERLDLERDLRSRGIPVQEGGLTSAVLLVEEDEARGKSGKNLTLIIAVSVGACAIVVGVLLVFFQKKKDKNEDGSYSPPTTVVPVPFQTTDIVPAASVQLAKNEAAVATVPFARSKALDFKMQAQSVVAEQEAFSHHKDESDETIA